MSFGTIPSRTTPKASWCYATGDEAIVYGNFFLNNMGGVRVREGQNHFIYNNYFSGLTSRAIYLQNVVFGSPGLHPRVFQYHCGF